MEEKTIKCANCEVIIEDTEESGKIIKCPMCEVTIEDVCILSPGTIARFYKWTGTINNIDGILRKSWYCPKHSINEITTFEDENLIR